MLSVEQAAALTRMVQRSLAERGIETVVDRPGELRGSDWSFGLHNLAVVVATVPWPRWSRIVRRHIVALSESTSAERGGPLAGVGPDRLYVKLRAVHDLPERPDYDVDEPLPGIIGLAAVDRPTHIIEVLGRLAVDQLGGWEHVRSTGLHNLHLLRAPDRQDLQPDPARPDSTVHVLVSDDCFGASRLLVLDDILRSVLAVERPGNGVLVAVPNRHMLVVHVLTGLGVVAASALMGRIAVSQFPTEPGPISPDVFYLDPAGVGQRVMTAGDGGQLRLDVTGRLAEAFSRLGLTPEGT
jgi:hypothetical protein